MVKKLLKPSIVARNLDRVVMPNKDLSVDISNFTCNILIYFNLWLLVTGLFISIFGERRVMKTRISKIIVLVFGAIIFSAAAHAETIQMLGQSGKFSVGVEFEYRDSDIDIESGIVYWDIPPGSYNYTHEVTSEEFNSTKYLGVITFMPTPNISLMAKAGMAKPELCYLDTFLDEFDELLTDKWDYDGDSAFAWGGGIAWKALEVSNGINFSLSISYLQYDSDATVSINGIPRSTPDEYGYYSLGTSNIDVQEVEATIILSKTFGKMTPFIGVGYYYNTVDVTENVQLYDNDSLVDTGRDFGEFEDSGVEVPIGLDITINNHLRAGIGYKPFQKAGSLLINWVF